MKKKMDDTTPRMTDPGMQPDQRQVESFIGARAYSFWKRLSETIELGYPGVFVPEWLYGGKKHGWSLRYKKGRSFCTFIPEKGRFMLLIVFGAKERLKVDAIRSDITFKTMNLYDEAKTYHDGKWLFLEINSNDTLSDAEKLLLTKREPRKRISLLQP